MPADRYWRSGHWVKKPSSKKKAGAISGWVLAAGAVVVVWALTNGGGDESSSPRTPVKKPAPASVVVTANPTITELPRIVVP